MWQKIFLFAILIFIFILFTISSISRNINAENEAFDYFRKPPIYSEYKYGFKEPEILENNTLVNPEAGSTYESSVIETNTNNSKPKLIFFGNTWFGGSWSNRFAYGDELKRQKCPVFNCQFTDDIKRKDEADAVIFCKHKLERPTYRDSKQMWVLVDVEAVPNSSPERINMNVNWTMTYHSSSDIVASYGYFIPKEPSEQSSVRPNLMDYESPTMKRYLEVLRRKVSIEIYGPLWSLLLRRPKLASWMSSHCPTLSRRERYIKEFQKYAQLDAYGTCGKKICDVQSPYAPKCWLNTMASNYFFYFSMENTFCDEYITEKLYNPLKYGLVPVVFGGADYSRFLPPHSYINALDYTPKELAKKLTELQNDPWQYGRYHLWRGFWDVYTGGTLCELCYKLHKENEEKSYPSFYEWRKRTEKCTKEGYSDNFLKKKKKILKNV